MKERRYSYITSVSVLAAIFSALLFDRAGKFAWVLGTFGILAAAAAILTYFWNQFRDGAAGEPPVDDLNVDDASKETTIQVSPHLPLSTTRAVADLDVHLDKKSLVLAASFETSFGFVTPENIESYLINGAQIQTFYGKTQYVEAPDPFVDQIVRIVDKLCSAEHGPSYEFVVNRDGSFLIRETKPKDRVADRLADAEPEMLSQSKLIQ